MRLGDWREQKRRRGIDDKPKESMTATEASEEEDEVKDYNKNKGGVSRGWTKRPRDWRQQRRRQRLNDGPRGLATTTEC